MATNRLFKSVAAVSTVCAWIVSGQSPKFAVAQTTTGAQQKANPPKKPATVPSAIPELPAGVDLPPEVQAELKKALDKVKQVEAEAKGRKGTPKSPSPANATPSSPKADSPKKPNPGASTPKKSTVRITKPSAPASTAFKRVATEKKIGAIGDLNLGTIDPKKPHFWVSPDGRRFAHLIDKGIAIDGQPHQFQNSIRQKDQFLMNFRFSPDSQRTAFVMHQGGSKGQGAGEGETVVLDGVAEKVGWNFIASHDGAVFSPDGKHIAYMARRYAKSDVEYVLMIDGKEREVTQKSMGWKLSFTPDNRRVIWSEDVGGSYQMRETSVANDEKRIDHEYGPANLNSTFFYSDSGQLGYIVSNSQNEKSVVYNGRELEPRFKELKKLTLSRDGKHIALVIESEKSERFVVVDGRSSKAYGFFKDDDVLDKTLVLSPTGGRAAYAIKKKGRQQAVVVDDREGKAYSGVAELTFSQDGKHLAYWGAQNGQLHMVIDGQEGPAYEELGLPVFSPDGLTLAYGAGTGEQKFIVVNGKPQPAYAGRGEPEFGPDGKRLVYIADLSEEGPSLLVDGGKEGKQYDAIREQLYFSGEGQRLAIVAHAGDEQLVVVDGVEGNRYDIVVTLGGGKVHFDAEDRFHYLAAKGGDLYLVEETIAP